MQACGCFAGEHGGARRGADWLRGIGTGETQTFAGETVQMRGVMFRTTVTSQIVWTEIISQDENDVWRRFGSMAKEAKIQDET